MNGDREKGNDPYATFLNKRVTATDILGVRWEGVLRVLTYSYITLDADLHLRREHIIALKLRA